MKIETEFGYGITESGDFWIKDNVSLWEIEIKNISESSLRRIRAPILRASGKPSMHAAFQKPKKAMKATRDYEEICMAIMEAYRLGFEEGRVKGE